MDSSKIIISLKSIEIENEGNKYICKIQLINKILNISLYLNNNILKYEGNITINKIQNQIGAFDEYNIDEIFEEINILNNNDFKIIKEKNNEYKLRIKFIILRRKKYLYINLYNNNNIDKSDLIKYILLLKEIIKNKNKKIKSLENKLNKQNNKEIDNKYNNFDIESKEPIHILNNHTKCVFCLSILKDGRLVSGSLDKSIIIYNKETYQPDLTIKEHKDCITCITTLSSGILASCSKDKTIKLYNINDNKYEVLQTLNYHNNESYKIIELKNKSLVSCSLDKSIIFYNKDNNKYIQDYKIPTNDECCTVIQTKDNEICYSESDNICFYDLIQRKIKSKIDNINLNGKVFEGFIMISKELLIIPGQNKISIININEYEIIRIIDVPNSNSIIDICMLNDNILFTGDENKVIREWKIEEDNLILISQKENAHNDEIDALINIGDGHIASCSKDKLIKIW